MAVNNNRFESPLISLMYYLINHKSPDTPRKYEYAVRDLSSNDNTTKKGLFSRKNNAKVIDEYKAIDNGIDVCVGEYQELLESIDKINYTLDGVGVNSTIFIENIVAFSKFLRTAEKLFLYNNDEYSYIYSEIDDNINTLFVKSNENEYEYKIRIKVEKTRIDNLLDSYSEANNLDDLLNANNKLTLVSIDVVRNYGKSMVSSFKFPLGSIPDSTDDTDKILYFTVISIITNKMIETYFSIIENTFNILGIKNLSPDKSYWENFKKYGLFYKKL